VLGPIVKMQATVIGHISSVGGPASSDMIHPRYSISACGFVSLKLNGLSDILV